MICHDLKCIFLHIPRCAGTSVEIWLAGQDWWQIDPATKHLTVRQARTAYAGFWDDYFKFAIVRHPLSRSRSCLKYSSHFGLVQTPDGGIDFSGYHALFGDQIIVERDHRFYPPGAVEHPGHLPRQVYGNILDDDIDFVAKFETLQQDMSRVQRQLGLTRGFDFHAEASDAPAASPADQPSFPAKTLGKIEALYERDFTKFGYLPDPGP